jgi:hypothetical protein
MTQKVSDERLRQLKNAVKSETVSPASAEYHSGEVDFMTQYSLTDAEMEEANKFLAQHGYASPKLIATTMLAAYASHVSSLSSQAGAAAKEAAEKIFCNEPTFVSKEKLSKRAEAIILAAIEKARTK